MRSVRGGRLLRAGLACAAVVAMVVQLGGCAGQPVEGKPKSAMENIDTDDAGGLEATDGPSGPKKGVEAANLEVENTDGGEIDEIATNAVADLYTYWDEQMPKNFDQEFEKLQRLLSYDSTKDDIQICGSTTLELVNAFYCGGGGEDVIAWDRGVLLPMLAEDPPKGFTKMSIVAVLAHEMGHAVQFRLGEKSNVTPSTPTIVLEQQADCYLGNFMRWVAEGESNYFDLNAGDGLNAILATLFFIRDPAGYDHMTEGAHGLAFDRVFAFQEGFTKDPKRCAEMDTDEIDERISEKERSNEELEDENAGEAELDDTNLGLLQKSLDNAFKDNNAKAPEITENGSECDKGEATKPATYCPDDNIIGIDLEALTEIATPPAPATQGGPSDAGGLGDFAAFAEIASRYALAIQKELGADLEGKPAALRTACLTGAWAKFTDQEGQELRLAVGDLDEAVAELLQEESLIAADVNGEQVPSGFARVEAFRNGYMEGSETCTEGADSN